MTRRGELVAVKRRDGEAGRGTMPRRGSLVTAQCRDRVVGSPWSRHNAATGSLCSSGSLVGGLYPNTPPQSIRRFALLRVIDFFVLANLTINRLTVLPSVGL